MTARTSEDARLRPIPGDVQHLHDGSTWTVTSRPDPDGVCLCITVQYPDRVPYADTCLYSTWTRVFSGCTWVPVGSEAPVVGALAAAYADAKRAMGALGTALKEYGADPGLHRTGLTWEYDGYFTWDGGDGYVSDDGLTLPYQSTVLWAEPHMADGAAYKAWVAAEDAKRVAAGREHDTGYVRLALRRLYGEAGVAALDALARGGA